MADFGTTIGDIYAFVDNELEPDAAQRVRNLIEKSPHAQKLYMNLMRQKMLLKACWEIAGCQTPDKNF